MYLYTLRCFKLKGGHPSTHDGQKATKLNEFKKYYQNESVTKKINNNNKTNECERGIAY